MLSQWDAPDDTRHRRVEENCTAKHLGRHYVRSCLYLLPEFNESRCRKKHTSHIKKHSIKSRKSLKMCINKAILTWTTADCWTNMSLYKQDELIIQQTFPSENVGPCIKNVTGCLNHQSNKHWDWVVSGWARNSAVALKLSSPSVLFVPQQVIEPYTTYTVEYSTWGPERGIRI